MESWMPSATPALVLPPLIAQAPPNKRPFWGAW